MFNNFKLHPKHLSWGRRIFLRPLFKGHGYFGANCAPVSTPSLPEKPFPPSQSKVLCTKDRDNIRPQTKSVRAPVVFGLYCSSSQNLIKNFCTKSELNPFSRIVGFSATPQLHITFS